MAALSGRPGTSRRRVLAQQERVNAPLAPWGAKSIQSGSRLDGIRPAALAWLCLDLCRQRLDPDRIPFQRARGVSAALLRVATIFKAPGTPLLPADSYTSKEPRAQLRGSLLALTPDEASRSM